MALVKVTVKCPHCKVNHEEYDATQYNDKEKYLAYWNIPFNTPEAEEAWQAKLNMTPKEAPMVIPDIGGHISMADGQWVGSRSSHRENLKRNGCIELGNDVPMAQKKHELSTREREHLKRTIAEVTHAKLR